MEFIPKNLSQSECKELYFKLKYPRIIEEKMLILLRQGKVGKWFSGIGQEAISVGITAALQPDEYIMPLHRNLGVFTTRNIPFAKLFAQWQGKASGFSKGRERSFHFGTNEHHIVGMISHLGAMLGVANGIATANTIDSKSKISVAFSGDGGTSEGDFHEALNVAAVWNLPVLFVVENNGYGLSTPSRHQFRCKQFIDKGIGYGMRAVQVDGNNILDVYTTVKQLAEEMRQNPEPILLECITFRMRGHEEASGTKYVPQELFDIWALKDPIRNYEKFLLDSGVLSQHEIDEFENTTLQAIDRDLQAVFDEPEVQADTAVELADVLAPNTAKHIEATGAQAEMRLVDAIKQGLYQSMQQHPNLVLMGQDIAEYGGVFKITEGFLEEFGAQRVRNTPITESSILGAGYGLSIAGKKAMVEMQFADFVSCGYNQIVNNLAKSHYRWGQAADVVVRMPTGAGVQAGPFHSQSTESWFTSIAGLQVYYPSNPADAKGLLCQAINTPNPVLFFEHKFLYRSVSGMVPQAYYTLAPGQAAVYTFGTQLLIVTYGWGVHKAIEYVQQHSIAATVIDLRTLAPWDKETVFEQTRRCNKVLVLTEDTQTGSFANEIGMQINQHCFQQLDAPVQVLGSLDTPVPLAKTLEDNFLPWNRMATAIQDLLSY